MSGRDDLTTGGLPVGDRMGDGSPALGGIPAGTGEVHSGLHSGPTEEYAGLGFAGTPEPATGGSQGLKGRVTEKARHAGNVVAEHASDLRERAGDAVQGVRGRVGSVAGTVGERATNIAGGARDRVGGAVTRAQGFLEERGVLDTIRENPLPALGVAFGIGFLLAGSDNRLVKPGTNAYRARNQVRSAIMAGLGAAVANEARALLGGAGESGPIAQLLGNLERRMTGGKPSPFDGGSSSSSSGSRGRSSEGGSRAPSHREGYGAGM